MSQAPQFGRARISHVYNDDGSREIFWGGAHLGMMMSTPSFKGLMPSSEAASRAKRANRRQDTTPEILLRRELWKMGLRYRKSPQDIPGRPDIVFRQARVAVFCDGDFWHGRNWATLRAKLEHGANAQYWLAKIARNIERDQHNTDRLKGGGWCVIRLWETDIKRDPRAAAIVVQAAVQTARQANTAPSSRTCSPLGGAHEVH